MNADYEYGVDGHYGMELILDLHGCDASLFNRRSIGQYLEQLCNLIGMDREDLHWWDYDGVPEEEQPGK